MQCPCMTSQLQWEVTNLFKPNLCYRIMIDFLDDPKRKSALVSSVAPKAAKVGIKGKPKLKESSDGDNKAKKKDSKYDNRGGKSIPTCFACGKKGHKIDVCLNTDALPFQVSHKH